MRNTASVGPAIPRQTSASLDQKALEGVVMDVWKHQLGRSLHRALPTRSAASPEFGVSACVPLETGAPLVAVLRVPAAVAASVASERLELHEWEIAPGDIDDAFTELIVAVGNGISRLLPDATRIGPPLVVQGSGLSTSVAKAQLDCEAVLLSSAGPVHASLWRPRSPWRPAA
jgi:hypothetical protein